MFSLIIEPRFSETDALGHISNTTFPIWFEQGRTPLFDIFHPSKDIKTWPLILARVEVDFLAQTYWGAEVEIKTYVGALGNSSCQIIQEAWQNEKVVVKGHAVMVYFDYKTDKAKVIPEAIRDQLILHLHDFVK